MQYCYYAIKTYGNLYIQSDTTGNGNIYADNAKGSGGIVEIQKYIANNGVLLSVKSSTIKSFSFFFTFFPH